MLKWPDGEPRHNANAAETKMIKTMKNKLILLLALILILSSRAARCQSTALSPSQSFFQTAGQYLTSANTNYTWAGNSLEVAAGADYMSSVNWANYLDAQYDFSSAPSFANRLAIEAKMRNAGIAGTVDSAGAGLQYTLISYYSIKLQAGVEGGYDLERSSAMIEPKLTLRDKLTPNTFAGVCLSLPIWVKGRPLNNVPDIGLEAGFTY
jgi:hypothetical protein